MDGFWKEKRVLVTGAGGFIGSHLVERLVAEGARVRAFVRYNSRGDPGLLSFLPEPGFRQDEVLAGGLRDKAAVTMEELNEAVERVTGCRVIVSMPILCELRNMLDQFYGPAAPGASNRILDVRPESLHDRTPLVLGSTEDVDTYEQATVHQRVIGHTDANVLRQIHPDIQRPLIDARVERDGIVEQK